MGGVTQGELTLVRVHNHPNYFQNGFFLTPGFMVLDWVGPNIGIFPILYF